MFKKSKFCSRWIATQAFVAAKKQLGYVPKFFKFSLDLKSRLLDVKLDAIDDLVKDTHTVFSKFLGYWVFRGGGDIKMMYPQKNNPGDNTFL